jgi:hypothetical protein
MPKSSLMETLYERYAEDRMGSLRTPQNETPQNCAAATTRAAPQNCAKNNNARMREALFSTADCDIKLQVFLFSGKIPNFDILIT